MSELPGLSGLPKPIVYKTNYNIWVPELAGLHVSDHLLPNYDSSDDNSNRKKRTAKRSNKDKKKHSRSSKRMRQYGLEGYILQVIGMLCFVLAAIKAFEPLTGVGFTLVLIGYNKNARKEARVDLPKEKQEKKRKKRRHRSENDEEVKTIDCVESAEEIESEWELISH